MTVGFDVEHLRTLCGVGIAPGIGEGRVLYRRHMGRTGFAEAQGRVVVCDAIGDSEAVLLLQARPAAIVITGAMSHGVAAVFREARIPAVGGISIGLTDLSSESGVIVDGLLGRVWRHALLVSCDVARR